MTFVSSIEKDKRGLNMGQHFLSSALCVLAFPPLIGYLENVSLLSARKSQNKPVISSINHKQPYSSLKARHQEPPVSEKKSLLLKPFPPLSLPSIPQTITETLENGIEVQLVQVPNAATIHFYTWFKDIGFNKNPTQRSGLTHLLEHLLLKDTENYSASIGDIITEGYGGSSNAYTGEDYISIEESIFPHIELFQMLCRINAERISVHQFMPEQIEVERRLVLRESNLYYADPFSKFKDIVHQKSFSTKRASIELPHDVQQVTAKELRTCWEQYIRDGRISITIAGDFKDPSKILDIIRNTYGKLVRAPQPPPLISIAEDPPLWRKNQFFIARRQDEPNNALALTYKIPGTSHPDTPLIMLIEKLIANDSESFLKRSLRQDGLVNSIEVTRDQNTADEKNSFTIFAVIPEGKSIRNTQQKVLREISRLRFGQFSEEALQHVKESLLLQYRDALETPEGAALIVSENRGSSQSLNSFQEFLFKISSATKFDIQRVARKYFQADQSNHFWLVGNHTKPPLVLNEGSSLESSLPSPTNDHQINPSNKRNDLPTVSFEDLPLTSTRINLEAPGIELLITPTRNSSFTSITICVPHIGMSTEAPEDWGLFQVMLSLLREETRFFLIQLLKRFSLN